MQTQLQYVRCCKCYNFYVSKRTARVTFAQQLLLIYIHLWLNIEYNRWNGQTIALCGVFFIIVDILPVLVYSRDMFTFAPQLMKQQITMKNVGKIDRCPTTIKHCKAWITGMVVRRHSTWQQISSEEIRKTIYTSWIWKGSMQRIIIATQCPTLLYRTDLLTDARCSDINIITCLCPKYRWI